MRAVGGKVACFLEISAAMGDVGAAMKTKHLVLSAVIAIPAIWSCDDGGDKGSGVAADKLLKDLNQADFEKVCKWNVGQFKSLESSVTLKQVCTAESAPDAESEAECKEAVTECVADGDEDDGEDVDEEDCEDQELPDVAAGCYGITIGDYEACVKGLVRGTKAVFTGASCKDYGEEPDYEQAADEVDEQCKMILNRCPSLLPGFLADDNDGPQPGFDDEDDDA